MKLALIGATGNVGRRLLAEAIRRGHAVTAIARKVADVEIVAGVRPAVGDLTDESGMADLLRGHDAVILSVPFRSLDVEAMLRAVKGAGAPRLLVVGGAASLEVAPGLALVDTPDFPEFIKPEAIPARAALERLRQEDELDWTYLSPSVFFGPGERTGRFQLGTDRLLSDEIGKSHISYEDYAVAMLDEIEQPRHRRARFTIGY
ncbi:NAD(P)-dependent oxidoreductase [Sphingosinicella terrae]|uniref:NAD(P)-dependent oxidoreductase n=1 Tax=Sphingosinicella terrae TaxID=2172047 RepID=UPI000E0D6861|nr:NAD(P)-dependent oxidoreductase [Sphingosinicella terrae]